MAGGNPVRVLKQRFPEDLVRLLLAWRWWDLPPEELAEAVPLLCDPDLDAVRSAIRQRLEKCTGEHPDQKRTRPQKGPGPSGSYGMPGA